MDDTPDTGSFLVVVIEDSLYICAVLQVAFEDLDLRVGFVLFRGVLGKLGECDLGDSVECFGERVVEAGKEKALSTRYPTIENNNHVHLLFNYADAELVGEETA